MHVKNMPHVYRPLNLVLLAGLILVGLAALPLVWSQVAVAQSAPLRLSFEKADPDGDGVWEGSVSGDLRGNLKTRPTFVDDANPVWRVEFDFVIKASEASMTLHLKGTLNTETGVVRMSGEVAEGYLQGARVREEGRLVDPETSTFRGEIWIMPRTAN